MNEENNVKEEIGESVDLQEEIKTENEGLKISSDVVAVIAGVAVSEVQELQEWQEDLQEEFQRFLVERKILQKA